jgi:hypothetical protein
MHSIKSVKNFQRREEADLVDDWFDRLHGFVLNPPDEQISRYNDDGNDSLDASDANNGDHQSMQAIDLTGTYTSIIRGYVKLRKEPSAAEKAWVALQRMQDLSALSESEITIATVDLKINPFNLFLGSPNNAHGTNHENRILARKISLLDTLIDSAKKGTGTCPTESQSSSLSSSSSTAISLPLPNEQSFVGCIKALSSLKNPEKIAKEAERIVAAYESLIKDHIIPPSPKVHNAIIELYIDTFGKDKSASIGSLLSICVAVSKRMEDLASSRPDIAPDIFTRTLFLKACSIDDQNPESRLERYEKAEQIMKELENENSGKAGDDDNNIEGDSSKLKSKLNDKCYFYMMKCVSNTISDPEEKRGKIIDLFKKATDGGFVSADVLKTLRTNTTNEIYTDIVGNGRLADRWVENVTSGLALYTDGTTGGAGKNARRKGKSTSNWVRKQSDRKNAIQSRNDSKMEKKRLKREREAKGKRRRS